MFPWMLFSKQVLSHSSHSVPGLNLIKSRMKVQNHSFNTDWASTLSWALVIPLSENRAPVLTEPIIHCRLRSQSKCPTTDHAVRAMTRRKVCSSRRSYKRGVSSGGEIKEDLPTEVTLKDNIWKVSKSYIDRRGKNSRERHQHVPQRLCARKNRNFKWKASEQGCREFWGAAFIC